MDFTINVKLETAGDDQVTKHHHHLGQHGVKHLHRHPLTANKSGIWTKDSCMDQDFRAAAAAQAEEWSKAEVVSAAEQGPDGESSGTCKAKKEPQFNFRFQVSIPNCFFCFVSVASNNAWMD